MAYGVNAIPIKIPVTDIYINAMGLKSPKHFEIEHNWKTFTTWFQDLQWVYGNHDSGYWYKDRYIDQCNTIRPQQSINVNWFLTNVPESFNREMDSSLNNWY